MSIPMVDLRTQYHNLETEIKAAVIDVLDKCHFILGENVSTFETEVAELCDAKYGIGVASGTDAITIALAMLGVGPGDEVITTPFTFVATTECVLIVGATPVYADIDPHTFNLDPESIRKAITPKTKAILPVHLYGQCANMEEITAIANEYGLKVVCDGAQAIGATRNGKGIGQMGDAATLSFYPTKNLGGFGDGGMVLTNSDEAFEAAKLLRFHGQVGPYTYSRVGYCSRLDEIQAAVLRVKLKKLVEWNETRRRNAHIYSAVLAGSPIIPPVEDPANYHIYHQYTMKTKNRPEVQAILKEAGVGSAIHYPAPLHVQEAYRFLGYNEGDLPNAEAAGQEVLSVPVYPELSEDQVQTVADALKQAAEKV